MWEENNKMLLKMIKYWGKQPISQHKVSPVLTQISMKTTQHFCLGCSTFRVGGTCRKPVGASFHCPNLDLASFKFALIFL